MQQPYGNYAYYPHPIYNHTPYIAPNSQSHPPFYGPPISQQPQPAPHNNNPPAPAPYSFDAAAYNLKSAPNAAPPFPKQHRRHQTTAAAPASMPLKSAMKKTMKVFNTAEATIGRQFSNPFHNPAANNQTTGPTTQMPRPRAYSNPTTPQNLLREDLYEAEPQEPIAYHMLVSFHGYNELRIEHVMKKALDDLRIHIWPLWKDGIETDTVMNNTCIVKFKNNPWDMGGPNIRQTYKLIVAFFSLFQDKGYSFQTAVNISSPVRTILHPLSLWASRLTNYYSQTPRLIFQVTQPDPRAHFFIAYFDHDGTRFTLIDPPNHIDMSIGARLRSALPPKSFYDKPMEEYARVIELKKKPNSNVSEVETSVFLVEILKVLNNLGFQLDASVVFSRRSALGVLRPAPRELHVFKGYLQT
ncbi:hypothetical protein BDN70DRAFT_859951 [Pholiota conissans]|uniref:Uncharacterized protein n=1 Tax=Pholiota conissans TaxID=109636 RepID=A0A9P5Z1H6_9AGAR|nr:hypothetical protein BDN70DRAFT_859951 [Pholiota conissans]